MKLLSTYLSLLLFAWFTLADIVAPLQPASVELLVRDDGGAGEPTQEQLELAQYLQELVVASGLTPENLTKEIIQIMLL